jgi:translocation and assembly module TamB
MRPALRRTLVIGASVLAVALIVPLLVAAWMLFTTPGGRGALAALDRFIPGTVEVASVRGSLWSPLVLEGLEYRKASLTLTIDRVVVRWSLGGLAFARLRVRSIEVDRVRVRAVEDPTPPRASAGPFAIRIPLAIRVDDLRLHDLRIEAPPGLDSLVIAEARFAGDWRDDELAADSLVVRAWWLAVSARGRYRPQPPYPLDAALDYALRPAGQPEFRGSASFEGPAERIAIVHRLEAPVAASVEGVASDPLGAQDFDLRIEAPDVPLRVFLPDAPPWRLSGTVRARGTPRSMRAEGRFVAGERSVGDFTGELDVTLTGDTLRIDALEVRPRGTRARIGARGSVARLASSPRADLALDWDGLVWPFRGDTLAASPHGRLAIRGGLGGADLRLAAALSRPEPAAGEWQARGRADTSRLVVSEVTGDPLGAVVSAEGLVRWAPALRWQGTASAVGLDPGRLDPRFPGELAADVTASGGIERGEVVMDLSLERLSGRLRQRPVEGTARARLQGGRLLLGASRLEWGAALVKAHGEGPRPWDLTLDLDIPDLSLVEDSLGGHVRLAAVLSGGDSLPRVDAEFRVDSLTVPGASAGALAGRAMVELGDDGELSIEVRGSGARVGGARLDTLVSHATGTRAAHRLALASRVGADSLRLVLRGGLEGWSRWEGRLDTVVVASVGAGRWWNDRSPAIVASAEEASIEEFCLIGEGRACLRADWRKGGAAALRVELERFPLALARPYLPADLELRGFLAGRAEATLSEDGRLRAEADVTQSATTLVYPRFAGDSDTLRIEGSRLAGRIDERGGEGSWSLDLAGTDSARITLSLPDWDPLRTDAAGQPLRGSIEADIGDLTGVDRRIQGVERLRGRLTSDLQIGGTLQRPILSGDARFRDGRADVPLLGLAITELGFAATADSDSLMRFEGGARSGPGHIDLAGTLTVRRDTGLVVRLRAQGRDFQASNTRDLKLALSPDLDVRLVGDRLVVRGAVIVPSARISQPRSNLAVVAPPSPDVVVVRGEADSAVAGNLEYDIDVRLELGDDVELFLDNLRGRVAGTLGVRQHEGEPAAGSGQLLLKEAQFRAYGKLLDVERGRLDFAGGPLTDPGLDLRATRGSDDGTRAGVEVTGTLSRPVLKLVSSPQKTDADILSYIATGRPLSQSGSSSAASFAAAQLGMQSGDVLTRQIAGKLGLQDAGIESESGLKDASLMLGTYLSPKLYVSYGIGLFEPFNILRMRYRLDRHWTLQGERGHGESAHVLYSSER